jgi:hypothetical protein
MGRLTANDPTGPKRDEARAWLEGKHTVPALEDSSLEGRRAFLDAHGDVLWAFWSEAFSLAYSDGTLRPTVALGQSYEDAGAEVADRLLEALRTRPTLEKAPAWTEIERWHGWFVGRQAAAARRKDQPWIRADHRQDEGISGRDEGASAALADLERLLDRWADILRTVVAGTGVAAIEFDWLWATRRARKPLSEAFAEHPAYGHLADADLAGCIRKSSAPGDDGPERIRRSRAGACAAFRFNLEEVARRVRAGPGATKLAAARRVFLGPAEAEGPYHRPTLAIDNDANAGFREALQRSAKLSTGEPDDGVVERLWRGVIICGLNKSVLRLLSAAVAGQLDGEMDTLVAGRPASNRDGEET